MTDKTGTTTYIYDFMSRLTQEEKDGKIKEYSYTVYGDLSSFKIYDGTDQVYVNNYTYDSMSRIVSTGNDASPAQFVYNANSQVTQKTLGDIVTTYSYNKIGSVTRISTVRDSENIYSMLYTYDNRGNITEENGTALSVKAGGQYTYDGMNRISYTRSYNGSVSEYKTPTYDAKNNMTRGFDYFPHEYDLNNRLIKKERDIPNRTETVDYVYDNNGNLCLSYPERYVPGGTGNKSGVSTSNEDVKIYEYDNFNRLIRYQCGETVANYEYNGDDQRVSKSVNGKTTYFIWNGTDMVYEYTADGDSASYTYGPTGILYRKLSTDTDTLYTYTTNYRGDVVVMTNGTTHEEYYYTSFGITYNTKNATETGTILDNPFRYCGEYTDSETGLIYLRNRYYDPSLGRFITEDPHWNTDNMIYGDDEYKDGKLKTRDINAIMQSSNLYVYCINNPMTYIDFLGYSIIIGVGKNGVYPIEITYSGIGGDTEVNYIMDNGVIRFDFAENDFGSVFWRLRGVQLGKDMIEAAKMIDDDYLKGRTSSGLNTELQLHWIVYKTTGIINAKVADMGAAIYNAPGYDSNAGFFQTADAGKILTKLWLCPIWGVKSLISEVSEYME